jgi:hypothetical protein
MDLTRQLVFSVTCTTAEELMELEDADEGGPRGAMLLRSISLRVFHMTLKN